MAEIEMVGCHHQLNGHEFEQTQGDFLFEWGTPKINQQPDIS